MRHDIAGARSPPPAALRRAETPTMTARMTRVAVQRSALNANGETSG
jgi:hypothetical protein